MLSSSIKSAIVLLSILASGARSQDFAENLNPKGAGCTNPSNYLQCYANNQMAATACVANCNKIAPTDLQDCIVSCGYYQLAANIGCWLTNCWNQVYSCAYQGTVIQYLDGADRLQGSINIPFYPPPEDALGRCVCNLGDVYGNITSLDISRGNTCTNFVTEGVAEQANCQCCYESSILSNILNVCPHNDLSQLGLPSLISTLQFAYNESASNKCSVLSSNPGSCNSVFSETTYATTLYNPGALPSGIPGTSPLSDLPGSLTDPGTSYTLLLFPAYTSVIVPEPYNTENAAATATASGVAATGSSGSTAKPTNTGSNTSSGSGTQVTGTGTNAATGTTSAPASTSAKSGASKRYVGDLFISCALALAVLANM